MCSRENNRCRQEKKTQPLINATKDVLNYIISLKLQASNFVIIAQADNGAQTPRDKNR